MSQKEYDLKNETQRFQISIVLLAGYCPCYCKMGLKPYEFKIFNSSMFNFVNSNLEGNL